MIGSGYTYAMPALSPALDEDIEPELSEQADHRWGPFAGVVVSGWLILIAFIAGLGALLTGPLTDSALLRWDRRSPVDLEKARTSAGDTWSLIGSSLGETLTVVAVAVIVGIGLLVARHWTSVLLLATALLVEVSVFVTTTLLIPRDRPDVEQLDVSPPTSSFPSGHTAASTALALTLAILVGWHFRSTIVRWLAWGVALLVGPIVAFSRVYRGMHHPSDVAAGLLLGIGCVVLAFLAVRAWAGLTSGHEREPSAAPLEETVQ